MTELLAQSGLEWSSWLPLAVLFLVLGLVFLIAELLTISFGALSLVSLACFGAGLYVAFNNSMPAGIVFLGLVVVLAPTTVILFLKALPNTRIGHRLISRNPTAEEVTATAVGGGLSKLTGRKGRTITQCRPAGVAEIDGNRVDVVTEGMVVYPDQEVEVVGVEGNRVVIRKLSQGGGS